MTKPPFKPSFKNLDRDVERYLDKFGDWDYSGLTPMVRGHDEAMRNVFDAYVEQKAYDAVVHYLLTSRTYLHGLNSYFCEVSDLFMRERQVNRLKTLWWAAIAAQKQHFWELLTYSRKIDVEKSLANAKKLALNTMGQFRDILTEFDQQDDVDRLDREIAAIKEGRRRKAAGKPDARNMDENQFWKIIGQAKQGAATAAEQVEAITADLEAMRGPQIKLFQKLLQDRMHEAMHWDIWALAFVAQDGCSDDAFEAFRAWLILQGREVFDGAVANINGILGDVPAGLETAADALSTAAPIAYEARTERMLKMAAGNAPAIKGEYWEEDDLAQRYPALVRHYVEAKS